MPECRNAGDKVSQASAFLPVGSCLSPASSFRHQGSVRYSWFSPALPSYGIVMVYFLLFLIINSP
jgi:hypothetical protein